MVNLPRTALVAGGSSGIGLGIARALARAGTVRLHLVARRAERLQQAADTISRETSGVEVHVHPCDLTDEAAVARLHEQIVSDHGAPEALVHTAGAGDLTTISEEASANLHLHWNSTVVTAYHLVRAFFDDLVLQDRAWITLAGGSPLQRWPNPALSYITTRRALSGFADALREDLHGTGVHVLFCEPPGISDGTAYFTDNEISSARLPFARRHLESAYVPADVVGRGIVKAMARRRPYWTSGAIRFLDLLFSLPIVRGLLISALREGALAPEQGGPPTGHHRRLAEQRRDDRTSS